MSKGLTVIMGSESGVQEMYWNYKRDWQFFPVLYIFKSMHHVFTEGYENIHSIIFTRCLLRRTFSTENITSS